MRQEWPEQEGMTFEDVQHVQALELSGISKILAQISELGRLVLKDIDTGGDSPRGAPGMGGEQALRCALIMKIFKLTFRSMAFHLQDSLCMRRFCGFLYTKVPGKSALQQNLSRIKAETWEKIRNITNLWARQEKLEDAKCVRFDSTGVKSDILEPTDNKLLYDCVRVQARNLKRLRELIRFPFKNHARLAKQRSYAILNVKGKGAKARREGPYRDLIEAARKTRGYTAGALKAADGFRGDPVDRVVIELLCGKLRHFDALAAKVIEQTERRVLKGESVPAGEKVCSIFEEHTDILRKGDRQTVFGHKAFLAVGKSGLILDLDLPRGNPADTELVETLLDRQNEIFGCYPVETAWDGGFASEAKLEAAMAKKGTKRAAFFKKCGLSIEDMGCTEKDHKRLRRFRAGIEGCISNFKRSYEGGRCSWEGWQGFLRYVHCASVAYNLVAMSRLILKL